MIRMWFRKYYKHIILWVFFIALLLSLDFIAEDLIRVRDEAHLVNVVLPLESKDIIFDIDGVVMLEAQWKNLFSVNGYAFFSGINVDQNQVYMVLKSEEAQYVFNSLKCYRGGLKDEAINTGLNLDYAGFHSDISLRRLRSGLYRIGVYLVNGEKKAMAFSKSYVYINNKHEVEYIESLAKEQDELFPSTTEIVKYTFDRIIEYGTLITYQGWAFVEGKDTRKPQIYLVFKLNEKNKIYNTSIMKRGDVTAHFAELNLNLDDSGFLATISKAEFSPGDYQIGIYIKGDGYEGFSITDKTLVILAEED